MKMTNEQKSRFKTLLAKNEADLSTEEKSELTSLQEMATKDGYDPAKDEEKSLNEDEIESIVEKALTKALAGSGFSADAIIAKVKEATKDAATAAAKEAPLTAEQVKGIIIESLKDFHPTSKMQHNVSTELPIAHRSGNLTVAQKQLLNICLMNSNGVEDGKKPKHMNDGIPDSVLVAAQTKGANIMARARQTMLREKVLVGGAGTGAELVDTDLSSDLQRRLYMESILAARMISREIEMPTETFKLPLTTTRPSFFLTTEGQQAGATDVGTDSPILIAKKLTGEVPYSYEADEDMIVAVLPMIQQGLGAGAAAAFEGALINGDTTGTHQDSDINAVARHSSKMFDGLRKLSLGATNCNLDFSTGGCSVENIGALRKQMKKFGMRPQDCVLVVGTDSYNDLILQDQVLTIDKMGPNATINTGVLANIFGIDIVPSEAVREDVNAAGIYDGVTTTKRVLHLIYLPALITGVRRGFTVEIDRAPRTQLNYVIASFRRDFVPLETPGATLPFLQTAYNF